MGYNGDHDITLVRKLPGRAEIGGGFTEGVLQRTTVYTNSTHSEKSVLPSEGFLPPGRIAGAAGALVSTLRAALAIASVA